MTKKPTPPPLILGSESDAVWPSHTPFDQILNYSAGDAFVADTRRPMPDHVAELSELLSYDTDPAFWFVDAIKEGISARKILAQLADKVQTSNDIRAARTLYAVATYASFQVMLLYLRRPELFNFITARHTILPCLASIHPNTSKVMAAMRKRAPLGKLTPESHVIGSRAWFTSDRPANVYARAIVTAISLNQGLEPIEQQKKNWDRFDKINRCKTHLLPFPSYIKNIDRLPRRISPDCVLQYWRKGKEMILEELPNFHLRPEWRGYADRRYEHGAKTGAIRHAIFKDILIALRTIAGTRRTTNTQRLPHS